MKSCWTLLLTFISLTSCTGQTQKNVDYGYINSGWTYINAGLKLQYSLPKDWHFLDATNKTYVKVGSNIKNIPAYTTPIQVSIAEFKKDNSDQIATLLAVSNLDTSATSVKKQFDYNADKTITLGMVYSDNNDIYSFLRKTCSRCNDETFKEIYFKDVKLGDITFNGYITGVTDNEGNKMGHFFGAKRIGSLYLICQYNFPDLNSFDTYKEFFKGLTMK